MKRAIVFLLAFVTMAVASPARLSSSRTPVLLELVHLRGLFELPTGRPLTRDS